MTLGERLRKARKSAKLTQEDVSKKLGVDFTTVSKWETDKAVPNVDTLRTLAERYNVSLSYLLDGETADELDTEDLDPELVTFLKTASPETRDHFLKYMRGEVSEPVQYTETEKAFNRDLEQGKDITELFTKYDLTIGGMTPTQEELEEVVKFFKALRIMKMM